MEFELLKTESGTRARAGIITTDHGKIETPIFMPVGTAGSVKGIHTRDLENDIGAQIILGNTYLIVEVTRYSLWVTSENLVKKVHVFNLTSTDRTICLLQKK